MALCLFPQVLALCLFLQVLALCLFLQKVGPKGGCLSAAHNLENPPAEVVSSRMPPVKPPAS